MKMFCCSVAGGWEEFWDHPPHGSLLGPQGPWSALALVLLLSTLLLSAFPLSTPLIPGCPEAGPSLRRAMARDFASRYVLYESPSVSSWNSIWQPLQLPKISWTKMDRRMRSGMMYSSPSLGDELCHVELPCAKIAAQGAQVPKGFHLHQSLFSGA